MNLECLKMIKDTIILKILIMLKKISNLGNSIGKKEQKEITGGRLLSLFPCYCNGSFVGNASTIQECWDMCPC
ncbi:MAG: hypothetical protein ACI9Y7_001260 [Dokdonia sp.]|jgi:hypothetical protein